MSTGVRQIDELLDELQFAVVDQDTLMGELHGIPTTLTLLSADPPAIMFQFRVNPEGTDTQSLEDIMDGVPEDKAVLYVEEGLAWFTLYDVSRLNNSSIHLILEQIAETIQSTDLAVAPGCLRCGGASDAQLMYIESRPTRVCFSCLDDASQEQQEVESDLNRASLSATLGLPGAGIFVVGGWAIFWTMLDIVLNNLQIRMIELNVLTIPIGGGLFVGTGWVLGWPTGRTLRRSIATSKAPRVMGVLFILAAATVGEIVYIAVYLLRFAGLFDLAVAAKLLGPFIANYTEFWISCKVILLVATSYLCALSASQKQYVRMDI